MKQDQGGLFVRYPCGSIHHPTGVIDEPSHDRNMFSARTAGPVRTSGRAARVPESGRVTWSTQGCSVLCREPPLRLRVSCLRRARDVGRTLVRSPERRKTERPMRPAQSDRPPLPRGGWCELLQTAEGCRAGEQPEDLLVLIALTRSRSRRVEELCPDRSPPDRASDGGSSRGIRQRCVPGDAIGAEVSTTAAKELKSQVAADGAKDVPFDKPAAPAHIGHKLAQG